MSLKSTLLAKAGLSALIASSEDPAAPAPTTPAAPAASEPAAGLSAEEEVEIADTLKATAAASEAKGHAAGVKEANERTAAVFADPAATANPKLAAFLLTETTSSSEKIIDQLKAQGPAAAPAASEPAAPAAAPAVQPTVASMAAATPAVTRDPGKTGAEDQGGETVSLADAFPGIDFSGKSKIVEDGMGALVAPAAA